MAAARDSCPVHSHNEWDPLEEVIVGDLSDATIPSGPAARICGLPRWLARLQPLFSGYRYPRWALTKARRELDAFVVLLEGQGVRVRRPDPQPWNRRYATPHWSARGYSCASPRDVLLVIGDELIEAPLSWRSRYFETFAYRRLLKEYFHAGARWSSAPRPQLHDSVFDENFPDPGDPSRYILGEDEPLFDAADVTRCGRDLFVMRCNTMNRAGITWLERHLNHGSPPGQPRYRVHEIPVRHQHAMHIDHHFVPLAPGQVLVNPQWVDVERLAAMTCLRGWQIHEAPPPDGLKSRLLRTGDACTRWMSVNVLMLDERRVVCHRSQPSMIAALRSWGFEPIPCDFDHYATFGGAFHCATLDIRRRGTLQSYVAD